MNAITNDFRIGFDLFNNKNFPEAYKFIKNNFEKNRYELLSLYKLCKIIELTNGSVGSIDEVLEFKDLYFKKIGETSTVFHLKRVSAIIEASIMRAGIASGKFNVIEKLNSISNSKSENKKPVIYALSCVWGREDLTKVFLNYYRDFSKKVYDKIDFRMLIVGSGGDQLKKNIEGFGFTYVDHPNNPLNEKWEFGIQSIKKFNPDAVILLGSDDFLSPLIMDVYLNWIKDGVLAGGFTDGYFLDIKNPIDFLYWQGYGGMSQNAGMPSRLNETMGMGRFYSRDLLDILGYSLWNGSPIDRGLDNRAKEKLFSLGIRCVDQDSALNYQIGSKSFKIGQIGFSLKDNGLFAVDIKYPEASVTPIKNYLRSLNGTSRVTKPFLMIEKSMGAELEKDLIALNSMIQTGEVLKIDNKFSPIKKYSNDFLYEFLKEQLVHMFEREDHGLPLGERGRLYAWYWGYYGRAVLDLYRSENDNRFKELFLENAYKLLSLRDDKLNLVDEERNRVVASWGSRFSNGKRSCEITSAGLIVLPIAEYCSLFGDEILGREVIATLMEFIDEGIKEDIGIYFKHLSDGIVEPLNHANLYAAALAFASKIHGAPNDFKNVALGVYKYFKSFVRKNSKEVIYWPYAPTPSQINEKIKPEALWKAGASIELPIALIETGIISVNDKIYNVLSDQIKKNNLIKDKKIPKFIDSESTAEAGDKALGTSLPGFLASYIQLNDIMLTDMIIDIVEKNSDYFPNDWLGEIYPSKGGSRSMIMAYAHLKLNYPHYFVD